MNIIEAYAKAQLQSDKKILVGCTDIGDKWAFSFKSSMLYSDPELVGGIHSYTVNKKTGTTGELSSNPDDMKFIWKGTPVNTRQFRAEERKGLSAIEKVISKILFPF